jgi:zinc and cadmium transporter
MASLLGGWLPRWVELTHGRMQTAISLVAGVVLGIGLLHLLPHGFYEWAELNSSGAIDRSVLWLLIGFLATFFLQRLFHFHTHEVPDKLIEGSGSLVDHRNERDVADHHQHHRHEHNHPQPHQNHHFSWGGVFFGLAIHSLVDGVALAAAMTAEWDHGDAALAGFAYFLAVVLHKPFDSLSITSLMAASGWSPGWRNAVNLLYSLVVPVGMGLFYLGLQQPNAPIHAIVGATLCFAAGACVCISSSDLLPELQFHSHDRMRLSVALALGLALAWGLVFVESAGHGPHGHSEASAEHHH